METPASTEPLLWLLTLTSGVNWLSHDYFLREAFFSLRAARAAILAAYLPRASALSLRNFLLVLVRRFFASLGRLHAPLIPLAMIVFPFDPMCSEMVGVVKSDYFHVSFVDEKLTSLFFRMAFAFVIITQVVERIYPPCPVLVRPIDRCRIGK